MDLDTARLRAFVQVAERGTVAAAAKALGYTAPAVSQQIGRLEAQLGEPLFDRVGGRLRVSERGEALLPLAREMLALVAQAAAGGSGDAHRRVVVCGFASALEAFVVPAISSLAARGVRWEVREAEDDAALRELRLGEADVAIVQEYDNATPRRYPARCTVTVLASDRLRLVAPPACPPRVRLAELAASGWLVNGDGTQCEAATRRVLRDAGITPTIVGRVGDNAALLSLVAAGHGATIVPELVLRSQRRRVTVARADIGVRRTISAVTRTPADALQRTVVAELARVARVLLRTGAT